MQFLGKHICVIFQTLDPTNVYHFGLIAFPQEIL